MLAAWYKKQMERKSREEGRDEGREEGIKGERKAWQDWRSGVEDWERREAEAAVEGSEFTEPRSAAPDEV